MRAKDYWCSSCRFRDVRCPYHRAKAAAWRRRRRGGERRRPITLLMVLDDVRAVAARLKVRRVAYTLYRREGSHGIQERFFRREAIAWPEIQRLAGLPIWQRGLKGIDRRPCHRCGEVVPWYSEQQKWCQDCRRFYRRRHAKGWQEDAA